MTTETRAETTDVQGDNEPIMCELHPQHDPFPTAASLRMHITRTHGNVPDADALANEAAPHLTQPATSLRTRMDPAALAQADMVGGAFGGAKAVDDSPEAIFDRQQANGGTFDPLTMKRVVVLGGRIRVRQTVGYDRDRGQAERIDYWDPQYGWVREGLIVERGRISIVHDEELGRDVPLNL